MNKSFMLKFLNFWPPYLGAGVRVTKITPDFSSIEVEMRLRFWNRNYVGTHFGGSLFSMTDPFPMLMLLENLGKDYIVWDKAASIRFKKPARGRVKVHFQLTREQIESIKAGANANDKVEPEFLVQIIDESGTIVAEVQKTLYVRRKDRNTRPDSRTLE